MIIGGRRSITLLFIGDVVAFILALYITLWLRHLSPPALAALSPYAIPFAFLFVLWTLVFYGAGLYGKRILLFPSHLPDALFKTQLANILFAALFFFFIPAFGIAPKTILILYLIVSLALVYLWRVLIFPRFLSSARRESAALCAESPEAKELFEEVNGNPRYGIKFVSRFADDPRASLVVARDSNGETLHSSKQTVSFEDVYEEVFDRVPLSKISSAWFREQVALADSLWYILAKRCVDILGGLVMGLITLLIAPIVYVANLLESPGPLFIAQERFGRRVTRITVYKFRSMTKNLAASGEWVREGENRITKVGTFLRHTSLDEFPQFVNVLTGELSLIGPRSDIAGLGERLATALPYYMKRYLVTPGITGWAQINQQYEPGNASPQSIEETKVRLAYDFYYLKHRSFGLDVVIALKTIKRMFFRLSSW